MCYFFNTVTLALKYIMGYSKIKRFYSWLINTLILIKPYTTFKEIKNCPEQVGFSKKRKYIFML